MFGQVREDVSLEASMAHGDALCIASGGETAFALLLAGADRVVAADVNPAQVYLVQLKAEIVRRLSYAEAVRAMCEDANSAFGRVREGLAEPVRAHFDARPHDLSCGLQNCGKADQMMRRVVRLLHMFVHRPKVVREMLALDDLPGQREFYRQRWDTWRWRAGTDLAFSRLAITLAFGRLFGMIVPRGYPALIRREIERVMTETPHADNPFLWQSFAGVYPPGLLPDWLTERGMRTLVSRLDRLRLETADVRSLLDRPFDLACFSNVLDAADDDYRRDVGRALAQSLRGRAVFRSFFLKSNRVVELSEGALEAVDPPQWTDRSFVCSHVEVVRKSG